MIGLLLWAAASSAKNYTADVNRIVQYVRPESGPLHHEAYRRLAYISDTWGPRMWGSSTLEEVIRQLEREARLEGFENVRLEPVSNFTRWQRGRQELTLFDPRPFPQKLKLIGLGGSVPGDVQGNVVVVSDYSELDAMKDKVKGSIVCFNNKWTGYGATVDYRINGPSRAAAYGATAVLLRSVTPFSIASVHTGVTFYNESVKKIPAAAITVEDAQMFARMQARNQTIKVHLILESKTVPNSNSNNLIFEIVGSTYPDQILLMGGHIDSWDTGSQTGANDDGGGFITVFEALKVLRKLGLRPKRTLRFIAWSGEEWGSPVNGAHQYVQKHQAEVKNHVVAFESDLGSTQLLGFGYVGSAGGMKLIQQIATNYMGPTGAVLVNEVGEAADTSPLRALGIPTMANVVNDTLDHGYYFQYHHTAGDSMTMMDPEEMDSNVVGIASMFYILADYDYTSFEGFGVQEHLVREQ